MGNVLNRKTLEYLSSVNTPDYPESEWIINPDLESLATVPRQYWKVDGYSVREMTSSEKKVVDDGSIADWKKTRISQLQNEFGRYIENHYSTLDRVLLSSLLANAHAAGASKRSGLIERIISWVVEVYSYYINMAKVIQNSSTTESVRDALWDFSVYDASDPKISMADIFGETK